MINKNLSDQDIRGKLIDKFENKVNIRREDLLRADQVTENFEELDYEELIKKLDGNKLPIKLFLYSIESKNLKKTFIDIYQYRNSFPYFNNLKQFNNIYDAYNFSLYMSDDIKSKLFFETINTKATDQNNKGIGKWEIFFISFVNSATKGKSNGDITILSNPDNHNIEIKGCSKNALAKLRGNNNHIKSPKDLLLTFKQYIYDNYKDLTSEEIELIENFTFRTINYLRASIDDIIENTRVNRENLLVYAVKSIYYQLFENINNERNINEDNELNSILEFSQYLANMFSTEDIIYKIFCILSVISYQRQEKFDDLFLGNPLSGNYIILSFGDNIHIGKEYILKDFTTNEFNIDDLKQLFNIPIKYNGSAGPSETGGANGQNYVVGVYVE